MTLVLRLGEIDPDSIPSEPDLAQFSEKLCQILNFYIYPKSITPGEKMLFFLLRRGTVKNLGILTLEGAPPGFHGSEQKLIVEGVSRTLVVCPMNPENAAALRGLFDFLVPKPLGLVKSFGCGDRLGLATPGHIRALRKVYGTESPTAIRANLAQQSMRENARTGRSPQSVIDDALWGVLQEGWRAGFGADADHLKTADEIDICVDAGYTFFTVDPGEFVDQTAEESDAHTLEEKAAGMPWQFLETSLPDLVARLTAAPVDLGDRSVELSREQVVRAVAKYGHVVAHTLRMYRRLQDRMGDRAFDFEMSVDETDTVTSLAEHIYIASELKRLDVKCASLAPRYVGRFEKGVDYLGEAGGADEQALAEFERSLDAHVAVALTFGPYKLSLHSGSDKFSIYPVYSRLAGDLVHVKTAGTSYLEGLRAIARLNPALFRDMLCFALERYPVDRASYHVSAEPSKVPNIGGLSDEQLPSLLDDFHAREALHVTFGSVLRDARLRDGLYSTLASGEEVYYGMLEDHFEKHIKPFRP